MYRKATNNGKFKYNQTFKDNNGKSRRVSVVKNNKTRNTEKEAYEELQAKIREILNTKEEKNIEFYREQFLQFKKKTVSHNTYKNYEVYLQLIEDGLKLKDITKYEYDKKLIEYRETYKPAVIKLIKTLFNVFFRFIQKYYDPEFNVVLEFTYTKEERYVESQKIKYIEIDNIPDVLETIEHTLSRNFVIIQLYTGLRAGALLALKKSDIDFKNKTISITKTRLQNGKVTSPKTASSITTIEVNETVLKILYDYISNQEYIFNVSISTLGFNLRKYDLSTHMFRHTHVALLVEAGVPINVISERLDHSKIDTTLDIYTHVTENMKLDLRTKLNNLCADFTQKQKQALKHKFKGLILIICCSTQR